MKEDKFSVTRIGGDSKFEGTDVMLREGDIYKLYNELKGPSFSDKEIKNRTLKYKIFTGMGKGYKSDRIEIPVPILGKEVILTRDSEGGLIELLNKKKDMADKFRNMCSRSSVKLIDLADQYIKFLEEVDLNYRNLLSKILIGVPNGKTEEKIRSVKEQRREKIINAKKKLLNEQHKLKEDIKLNCKLNEDEKFSFNYLIDEAHFLLYNSIIIGSGKLADIKIDEDWVSEHQGLVFEGDWSGSYIYRNIGLCESKIIKLQRNKEGVLEYKINDDLSLGIKEFEIIDLNKPEWQRTYLFLSQKREELKHYEMFKTTPGYICFEVPEKK